MPSFPTFVINGKGERRGIDWGFNTWGGEVDGLYPSWENDNRVASKFCNLLGNDVYDKRDFICEDSSIHADGENDPQYALPSQDRTLCWPPGRTGVQPRRLTAEQVHKDGQELGITLYGQYLQCL